MHLQSNSTRILLTIAVLGATLLLSCIGTQPAFADERSVTTQKELVDAIDQLSDGDTVSIEADVVVTEAVSINKSLTIKGNGYSLKVPSPGFLDSGVLNQSASGFRIFTMDTPQTSIRLENLTLMGGSTAGGALLVGSSVTVSLNQVVITNSGGIGGSGGGISNSGTLYVNNSSINRNGANFGGGFLNSGFMAIENSSFSENRSLSISGGGGAGENKGQLYINNCTFSNNKSTELGGAINDYQGMTYIMNSTFTGNVTYSSSYGGGALRGNASVVVNCIFAYNYRLDGSSYILNDYHFTAYSGSSISDYRMINSIFHAQGFTGYNNPLYTGSPDGSDNSLVSKGINARVLAADGSETGTSTVFQPYLYTPAGTGTSIVPLKTPAPDIVKTGVRTIFDPYAATPVFAYYNDEQGSWYTCSSGSAFLWTTLADPDLSREVTKDQSGNDRSGGIGGTEYETDSLFMVKLVYKPASAHGTVHGATVYGDVYKEGETVTIITNPDQGYYFDKWKLGDDTDFSPDNPLQFTVTEDVVLYPLYIAGSNLTPLKLDASITPPLAPFEPVKASATLSGEGDVTYKPVTFYVLDESGKIIYAETVRTDENGKASFKDWIAPDSVIKYEAYISFTGDSSSGSALSEPVLLDPVPFEIVWGTADAVTYGQTMADVVVHGASANAPGSFIFPDTTQYVGDAGQRTVTRHFVPENTVYEPIAFEMPLEVLKKALAPEMVSVSDCIYDGQEQDGALVVADGSPSLIKTSDYDIAYSNNTEVGTAKVTITAKEEGNYYGTVEKEFKILGGPDDPGDPDDPVGPSDPGDSDGPGGSGDPSDPSSPSEPGSPIPLDTSSPSKPLPNTGNEGLSLQSFALLGITCGLCAVSAWFTRKGRRKN